MKAYLRQSAILSLIPIGWLSTAESSAWPLSLLGKHHSSQRLCTVRSSRPGSNVHLAPPGDHLLPSLAAEWQLLLGRDFTCIADQLDILDPAGAASGRMAGYYDGLRIVETEHQLYDVWWDRHPAGRTFTHAGTAGLSAARLDRWLLSQQLRPWVSTASGSLTQTAGYPGDHIGVSVTLTAPGGTCFGRAAWRLPLYVLDDEAFCADLAAISPEYLEAHPSQSISARGSHGVFTSVISSGWLRRL